MSYQYLYSGIPMNQNYIQDLRLIQYNANVNPFDPLGQQINQYIVMDPSHYVNKSYNIQNDNQVYSKQLQSNQQMNIYQNQNGRQTIPFHIHNHFNQPQIQINQNIPQQIYFKKNIQTFQEQKQIKPEIPSQHNQKTQPLILQKPPTQQNLIINSKQIIPQHPQMLTNFQPQINPVIQHNGLNQEVQLQQKGYMPGEIQYQKYIQKYPFQNQSKKISIEYNKKDEHFVNKEISPKRKHRSYNSKDKPSQEQKKKIKVLPRNEILNMGIKIEETNNNLELPKNKDGLFNNTKMNNKKLSIEEGNEKEIDIKQIEASNILSQISNKSKDVKECPIEEKKPEPTFPELMDIHNHNIIIQKAISQSGISDFDVNLSHLPTINSILRGDSDLLPQ